MRPGPPTRRLGRARRAVAVACVLAGALAPCAGIAADRVNVLVVSIDSLRRDALGCYGARLPHAPDASPSPNVDRLAAAGVRLADAYAPSPWTLPSHMSLMTGQSPLVHQVETDLHGLGDRTPTLAEILLRGGYHTAGVFSGPYLESRWGFGRGFERYRASYGGEVAAASQAVVTFDERIARAERAGDRATAEALLWERRQAYERVRQVSHADVSSERVTRAALESMVRLTAARTPWFLFVHYFDVHYDYVPPPPWDRRFDPAYQGTMTGRDFFGNPAIAIPIELGGFLRRVSARDLEHLQALYAGEVGWVDAHVGRLLDRLEARDAAARTLVVVLSDHGDEFFEHGGVGHRRNVAEEVLRVPMVLRLPGVLPAGRVTPGVVSLADVFPTVLELVGLPPTPDLTGRSILPLVHGTDDGPPRSVLARLVRMFDGRVSIDGTTDVAIRLATVQEAFRQGPIKIVRRRRWPLVPPDLGDVPRRILRREADRQFRSEELGWFDLERSPAEPDGTFTTDFQDPRARAVLASFQRRYRELRSKAAAAGTADVSGDLRARLEGLGYLESGPTAPTSPREGFALPLPGDVRKAIPR